jgi:N-acetylmuramoyl-L-alanine amidase
MVGKLKPFIILMLLAAQVSAVAQTNLQTQVLKGEGIYSLLKRFDLHEDNCNMDSFLSLNDLGPTDFLILEKKYVLPIKTFTFNGTSIRTSINDEDYEKAVRIQQYNERLTEKGVKAGDYRKDKILWVPYHELYCGSAKPGFTPYITVVPILGEEHKQVHVVDEDLKNRVYYLVSGHGGPDPGAMTKKDGEYLCEDEYAYDVTLRLAKNLISHGATVYIIIRDQNDGIRDIEYLGYDHDEVCYFNQEIPRSQVARLKQRVDAVNKLYDKHRETATSQRLVTIHVDSRNEGQKIDIFFYHYNGSKVGENLANTMLNTIRDKYSEHQKNREYRGVVKTRDLYMLRESKPSSVYIELGNITNDFDQKRLLIVNNRQAIANWLALGLMNEIDGLQANR